MTKWVNGRIWPQSSSSATKHFCIIADDRRPYGQNALQLTPLSFLWEVLRISSKTNLLQWPEPPTHHIMYYFWRIHNILLQESMHSMVFLCVTSMHLPLLTGVPGWSKILMIIYTCSKYNFVLLIKCIAKATIKLCTYVNMLDDSQTTDHLTDMFYLSYLMSSSTLCYSYKWLCSQFWCWSRFSVHLSNSLG